MNNNIPISDMVQHLSQTLLGKFFLDFSRFEYALKASGYVKSSSRRNRTGSHDVEPDWKAFREAMENVFQIDRNKELQKACQYIFDYPPKKQVIVDNSTTWETPVRDQDKSNIEFLLDMVRCIRNNLFHGSKHDQGPHKNTKRTELLLKNGLLILHECLNLKSEVKREYDQAIIQ